MSNFRFPIGTQYLSHGKHPRLCTVSDQMTVTNSKGEVTKRHYHATHEMLGQTVSWYDVNDTNIAKGIERLTQNP